ncbi:TnsA-like heteromeric transposase endonuclease subunit [Streptomyces sp. NPDC017988]|uniref:TnsA-like heteromeric transposase endonuclease subunit n=1 Tax=Streptomyces sp. NPDC017988 TaxID=3365025 RepID=UPI0037B06BB2
MKISSQPFWLFWSAANGRPVSHAPDYFARRDDGTTVVLDCRPADHRGPRDRTKFEATEAACAEVGWEFQLLGAPDPVVVRNVRWLAGYRQPRHRVELAASRLREVFAEPLPLMDGAVAVGEPLTVLSVLFHLLWSHELTVEVSVPLHAGSLVSPGAGR